MKTTQSVEIQSGQRFEFGENWTRFLEILNEDRILHAKQSLQAMLGVTTLQGKTFLDAGSGSGLFSLAARILGARVHSFDYDPKSVMCTKELKRLYFTDDVDWTIEEGSVLDRAYLDQLGQFDYVYSWGVLHHTGDMHHALANVAKSVGRNGMLFIAIYNDQGWISKHWLVVKKAFNRNSFFRFALIAAYSPYLFGFRFALRTISGRLALERGMSIWHDMLDWLGGLPFEVAKPEDIIHVFRSNGFNLEKLRTCGGRMGCNEFVFSKTL